MAAVGKAWEVDLAGTLQMETRGPKLVPVLVPLLQAVVKEALSRPERLELELWLLVLQGWWAHLCCEYVRREAISFEKQARDAQEKIVDHGQKKARELGIRTPRTSRYVFVSSSYLSAFSSPKCIEI